MTKDQTTKITPKKVVCFFSIMMMTVMLIGLLPVHGEEKIYDDVLRLHVIANSDSKADQALKLKVRDSILDEVSQMLSNCTDFNSALMLISQPSSLERLTSVARKTVTDEGYDYDVTVSVGEEAYPRKQYESLCFPSGNYTSLKVQIGSSSGQNWWCVLFPRLCLGAATKDKDNGEEFVQAGFTPEQYKIVTDTDEPQYEVKFKILEILGSLVGNE